MFRFENPIYLYALTGIILFIALFVVSRIIRKRLLSAYGEEALISQLFPDVSKYKPAIKLVLVTLAFAFLVFGIANPQIGTKLEEVKREGVEIMIAIDVSNSMMTEDIKPNRLARAKQSLLRLIDNLQSDRIGIVAFAGESFLLLPLTTDYSAAKMLISTISTDLIQTQGTAIGSAITLAMDSFSDNTATKKAIIVITDGENHEDNASKAATEAAEKGIVVHTIGMGSVKGGPIPIYSGSRITGYQKDAEGKTVISKLDAGMLQQIAIDGGGKFTRSVNSDPDLSSLINDLAGMKKTKFDSKVFTDFEDRFQYFLAAALLLLVIEFFLSDKKNRFISALNLFAEGKK